LKTPVRGWAKSIESVLKQLGARDIVVNNYEATFSVLQPIQSATPVSGNEPAVPARWEKVTLDSSAAQVANEGPISVRILPLFTTRNLAKGRGDLHATVEVLRPASAAGS